MTKGERAALANLPTALYRFYDSTGKLLYVGITENLERRWQAHKVNQLWWLDVARKEHVWFPTRSEAESAEFAAIRAENPEWDKSRTPSRGETWCDNPRKDPREELLVSDAAEKISQAIQSGVFPAWTFLPTPRALSNLLTISIRAAAMGRCRLSLGSDPVLSGSRHHYLVVSKADFPAADSHRFGEVYVLARRHFGSEAFTAVQLAERIRLSSVWGKLAELEKVGLVVRSVGRPTRFRLKPPA